MKSVSRVSSQIISIKKTRQSGSFVITDTKGEILKTCGKMLEEAGYRIRVFNLQDNAGMMKATRYNPFLKGGK